MTCLARTNAPANESLSHDDKLLGAAAIFNAYQAHTIESLSSTSIMFGQPSIISNVYQHCPFLCNAADETIFNVVQLENYETQCFDNLYQHLRYLQLEFIGHSELSFYHAVLIVLLRRGYEVTTTFKSFESLWQTQADYFFEHLSLRWLTSAVDSFIDFSPSPLRRAILMNVVSLINTLKIYETKLFLLTDNKLPIPPKVNALYAKHEGLYEGLTFFRLGSDDTLEQMRRRFLNFEQDDAFATQLLLTVFYRLHVAPSAFALIKQLHTEDWGYRW